MIKELINTYFARHYGLQRASSIDDVSTNEPRFDLLDKTPIIFPFGSGYASFANASNDDIHILLYEKYIDGFRGTHFETGRKRCDFIIYDTKSSFVALNEITSTNKASEGLKKPITKNDKNTIIFEGGKFEKAEKQLLESLKTLRDVDEIKIHLDSQSKRICLCSYKLYTDDTLNVIGNPVSAFNRNQTVIERETGENGIIISCPEIESLGFEYRRISHNYSFKIN